MNILRNIQVSLNSGSECYELEDCLSAKEAKNKAENNQKVQLRKQMRKTKSKAS